MSSYNFYQTLLSSYVDGAALTAAAAASALPGVAKFNWPSNYLKVDDKIRIEAHGLISCVVATPGTARFDVRMAGVVVFDTGALNLNIVAKTNVPWELSITLGVKAKGSGTGTTLQGSAKFISEAVVGAAANTAGGNGILLAPVSGMTVGTGFDCTISNVVDLFFTQTVATGSLTLKDYEIALLT